MSYFPLKGLINHDFSDRDSRFADFNQATAHTEDLGFFRALQFFSNAFMKFILLCTF